MINGEYTYKGAKLNAMDAPERAIARAGGGIYDAITNTAK